LKKGKVGMRSTAGGKQTKEKRKIGGGSIAGKDRREKPNLENGTFSGTTNKKNYL